MAVQQTFKESQLISPRQKHIVNICLFLIISLGFFLRIYKIDHHLLSHDLFFEEPSYLKMMLAGEFSQVKRFNYPPLFDLWLHFINRIYFLFYFVSGHFKKFADLASAFNLDYSRDFIRLLLTHRVITAIIGTVNIGLMFVIGRNLFNYSMGLISAFFLAVIPLHLHTSIDAVGPDNLQLLFISLSFLFILKIFLSSDPERKFYVLSGVCIGLAAAFKYFGIFCLLPLFFAHFRLKNGRKDKYLYLSLFLVFLILGITSIAMWLNPGDTINTFKFFLKNYGHPLSENHTLYQTLSHVRGWISYPNSMIYGLGPGIFGLSVLSLLFCLFRHNEKDMFILIFPLGYYLFIGFFYNSVIEYFLPQMPFLILLCASFLYFLTSISRSKKYIFVLYLSVFFICLPSIKEGIYFKNWLHQKSIEEDARNWILKNIPPSSYVLFDGADVGDSHQLEPYLFYGNKLPFKTSVIDWSIPARPEAFFNDNKFDYVIIDATRNVPAKLRPTYRYIENNFVLLKEFNPSFPTPKRRYFSIYGVFYNHSFKVFKKAETGKVS